MDDNDTDTKLRALEQALEQTRGERDKLKLQLHAEKIGNAFARSSFIQSKVAIPADMMQAVFGQQFSIDDNGRLVAKKDGTTVLSRHRFSEPADFDEAIELLVNEHPEKARILAASRSPSAGARPTNGAAGKTMTRAEFDRLNPLSRMETMRAGFRLTD